jgi:hypothetical protein
MWNWLYHKIRPISPYQELEKDYRVIEKRQVINPVEILTGRYKGIVLYFGNVVLPIEEDAPLKFQYKVVENPRQLKIDFSPYFYRTIEFILVDLIIKNYREQEIEMEDDVRTDSTE